MPMEASSSSAWTMATLLLPLAASTRSRRQWLVNASAKEDDGVMGYHAHTVAPAYTAPNAAAEVPSMKILAPAVISTAQPQTNGTSEIHERPVAPEMQRMHIRADQFFLRLELLPDQLLDHLDVHVEQSRERADLYDVLE